ncbi:hypothetical protein CKA32_004693 [Geitlerinema sp. FC II]|nr:hypothetical protein CKA32_004693 [Geitlerinema sp. FC II]
MSVSCDMFFIKNTEFRVPFPQTKPPSIEKEARSQAGEQR